MNTPKLVPVTGIILLIAFLVGLACLPNDPEQTARAVLLRMASIQEDTDKGIIRTLPPEQAVAEAMKSYSSWLDRPLLGNWAFGRVEFSRRDIRLHGKDGVDWGTATPEMMVVANNLRETECKKLNWLIWNDEAIPVVNVDTSDWTTQALGAGIMNMGCVSNGDGRLIAFRVLVSR